MKFITHLIAYLLLLVILTSCNHEKLSYIKKESYHDDIKFNSGKVVLREHITVKNNTNDILFFTMKADITREKKHGLTKEKFSFADKDNSDKHKVFKIRPNQKKTYEVKFYAKHGDENTKTDRNPVDNVIFILN